MSVRLEDWFVSYSAESAYVSPELVKVVLIGKVYGHPRKADGKQIQTSSVTSAEGRLVSTKSGTVYRLGDPKPEYREYLRAHRPQWDPENPIAVKP